MNKYFDRQGCEIPKQKWKELQKDDSYRVVKRYDNGVVFLALLWSGAVANSQNYFPTMYPLFVLIVKNYRDDGTQVNDPVDSDKTFATEEEGLLAYREFLTRWSGCHVDENGDFVEQDNSLAPILPPEPPDPNKPTSVSCELDDLGAW